MILHVEEALLQQIQRYAEAHYPEEAAGLILGAEGGETRRAIKLLPLANRSAGETRQRSYRLDPQDLLSAELEAQRLGLSVLGIFHSHPDHPAEPSQHDLQQAFPWFSYVITCVQKGKALETRSWRLHQDRSRWSEERTEIQTAGEP